MWKVIFLIVSSFSMLCVWMALAASQQNINFSFYKILIFHCCFSANMKVYRRRQPTLPSPTIGHCWSSWDSHPFDISLIDLWRRRESAARLCFMEAANYFRHFLIYTKSLCLLIFFLHHLSYWPLAQPQLFLLKQFSLWFGFAAIFGVKARSNEAKWDQFSVLTSPLLVPLFNYKETGNGQTHEKKLSAVENER